MDLGAYQLCITYRTTIDFTRCTRNKPDLENSKCYIIVPVGSAVALLDWTPLSANHSPLVRSPRVVAAAAVVAVLQDELELEHSPHPTSRKRLLVQNQMANL